VPLAKTVGDFIIHRKDKLYAYQLAVALDDAHQNINQVVRGYDLLSSTCRQRYLLQLFGYPAPHYAHIPVIVNRQGQKLSKQTFAQPLRRENSRRNLYYALCALGQQPPLALTDKPVAEILAWALRSWNIARVSATAEIPYATVRRTGLTDGSA